MAETKRQHEALRVPQGWEGQAKALIMQLERILTQLYQITGKTAGDLKEASVPVDITSDMTWVDGVASSTTNTKLYRIGSLRHLVFSCLALSPAFTERSTKKFASVGLKDYPDAPAAYGFVTGFTTTGQVVSTFRMNISNTDGSINITSESAYSGTIYLRGAMTWVV